MKRFHIYIIISFICPIVAVAGMRFYQWIGNSDYWSSLTPEYSAAGALLGFVEVIQVIFALLLGCIIGLVFAGLYFWSPRNIKALGIAAVIYNGLPFIFLVIVLFSKV